MLSGTRVVLVGLGGIGRQVAATLSAAGAEVIGVGRPGRTCDVPGVTAYTAALPWTTSSPRPAPSCLPARSPSGPAASSARASWNCSRQAPSWSTSPAAWSSTSRHGPGPRRRAPRRRLPRRLRERPLPEASPLWDLDNVLVSPHTASTVTAENSLITDLFIDNLRRWLRGTPLRNTYDRTAGY